MRRQLRRTAIVVFATSLLLMGAARPAKTVPSKKWAATFCTSIGTWRDEVKAGATSLSSATGSSGSTPQALIGKMADYLAGVTKSTHKAGATITRAGTPDSKQGKQAAAAVVKGFKKAEGNIRTLTKDLDRMQSEAPAQLLTDLAPYKDGSNVQTALQPISDGLQQASTKYDNDGKLGRAMSSVAACKALNG